MRRLVRAAPPQELAVQLERQMQRLRRLRVSGDAAVRHRRRKEEAERNWKNAGRTRLEKALMAINGGSDFCCYCNWNRWHTIDHFYPRAADPFQTFHWKNLLPACGECQNRKGDRFPAGLLNPASSGYRIEDHIYMSPQTGWFTPKTPAASAAEPLYGWNDGNHPSRRRKAFKDYCNYLRNYGEAERAGDAAAKQLACMDIKLSPFPAVLSLMIAWIGKPEESELPADVAQILRDHPEIRGWV